MRPANPPPKISVVVKTFRPGGFDVLTASLAQQTFDLSAVELIVVDELHRWRKDTLEEILKEKRLPYRVKHVPTRDSLFPVSSTMRAGNTALSVAEGKLWVQSGDHMVMPPNFLQAHWDLYEKYEGKAIGVYPYETRKLHEKYWLINEWTPWAVIESLVRNPKFLTWSIVRPGWVKPGEDLLQRVLEVADEAKFEQSSPIITYGAEPAQVLNEWYVHYRCDSVPIDAMKRVNGWDEEYDGGYGFADFDMTIRLQRVGVIAVSMAGLPAVQVIDMHAVALKIPGSAYRDYVNRERVIKRREEPNHYRCDFGLVMTDTARAKKESLVNNFPLCNAHTFRGGLETKLMDVSGGWVGMVISRSWLPGGRLFFRTGPREALAWLYVEPPVLHVSPEGVDGAKFVDVLGQEQAQVMSTANLLAGVECNPVKTVVVTLEEAPDGAALLALLAEVEKRKPARLVVVCPLGAAESIVDAYRARSIQASVYEPDEVVRASGAVVAFETPARGLRTCDK